jgi:nucleolar protein 58
MTLHALPLAQKKLSVTGPCLESCSTCALDNLQHNWMLVLLEVSAGFALFRIAPRVAQQLHDAVGGDIDESSSKPEAESESSRALALDGVVSEFFGTPDAASEAVQLRAFERFQTPAAALETLNVLADGESLPEALRSFLADNVVQRKTAAASDAAEKLVVSDRRLRRAVERELGLEVVESELLVCEVLRAIRRQLDFLLPKVSDDDDRSDTPPELSQSLAQLDIRPDPESMVRQAVDLLENVEKDLKALSMRVREWYGWHFPELGKILTDDIVYAKVVRQLGLRTNAPETDLSEFVPEELEKEVKAAGKISMGADIDQADSEAVVLLCNQVVKLADYRELLRGHLVERMRKIAPNLTQLVGELEAARLVARAGSLQALANGDAGSIAGFCGEKSFFSKDGD